MTPTNPSNQAENLGLLSQEIRTAMNSVMGVTGLLTSTPLEPEQVEYVNTIREGVDTVLALVEELCATPPGNRRPPSAIAGAWPKAHSVERPRASPGSRLLLVEDNLIDRRVITRLLENLGHKVQTATNGLEALDAVRRHDFDLVFMDIQMPMMDGLEATREIRRQIDPARQPWIVALTAAVLPEDRSACSEAGADDYLGKPVRTGELADAIRRAAMGERRAA